MSWFILHFSHRRRASAALRWPYYDDSNEINRSERPDGVFNRYTDVSPKHRLERYASAYEGRDVWTEFCTEHEYDQNSTDRYRTEVDRVGSDWTSFMADRPTHHALATPVDVEAWCQHLLATKSTRRSYDYWLRIRRFYNWLHWHPEHPHVYRESRTSASRSFGRPLSSVMTRDRRPLEPLDPEAVHDRDLQPSRSLR